MVKYFGLFIYNSAVILAIFLIVLMSTIPSVEARGTKQYYLEEGGIKTEAIEPKNEPIDISILVLNNASNIDIYIMLLSDFSRNMLLQSNFTNETLNYTHNAWYWNITFIPPTDDNYVIVLDNSDNFRNNDTVPVSDVHVSLNIHYTKSEVPMTLKGFVVTFISIIFIVLTLFRYYKRKKNTRSKFLVK